MNNTRASGAVCCVVPIVLVVGLAMSVGCAPAERATVSGKVTIDGRPLDRGVVTFVNALQKSNAGISGQVHSDGFYDVQIGQSGQVVAGEYAVTIIARKHSVTTKEGAPPTPGELLVPDRYTRTETSGLRYHVRPGENVIDIALAGDKPAVSETTDAPGADEGAQSDPESNLGGQSEREVLAPATTENASPSPDEVSK